MLYEEGSHSRIFCALMTDLLPGSPTAAQRLPRRAAAAQWPQQPAVNEKMLTNASMWKLPQNWKRLESKFNHDGRGKQTNNWCPRKPVNYWDRTKKKEVAYLCPPFTSRWKHPLVITSFIFKMSIWGRQMAPPSICTSRRLGETNKLGFLFFFNKKTHIWLALKSLKKKVIKKDWQLQDPSHYVQHFRPAFLPKQQLIWI